MINNKKKNTLLQMIKEDPNDPFLHFALAKEYEKYAEIDHALDRYAYLIKIHPEYVGSYYHYGQLLGIHVSKDKAISIINQGIAIAKKQSDHHSASELLNAKMNLEIEE